MGAEQAITGLAAIARAELRRIKCRDLDLAHKHVVRSAMEGTLSLREYRRCLVKLAYSYTEIEGDAQALRLLAELSPGYLEDELPEDAVADADLLTCTDALAAWLVRRGHVDGSAMDGPTVPVLEIARA